MTSIITPDHFAGLFPQGALRPDRAAARGVRARAALWRRGAALLAGRVPRDAQGQEGHGQELQDIRRKDLRGAGERCLSIYRVTHLVGKTSPIDSNLRCSVILPGQ